MGRYDSCALQTPLPAPLFLEKFEACRRRILAVGVLPAVDIQIEAEFEPDLPSRQYFLSVSI